MGELERLFPVLTPIHRRAKSHPLPSLWPITSLSHLTPSAVGKQLLSFSVNAVVPVVLNMTDYHANHPYGMSNFALSFKKKRIFPVTHQWGPDVPLKTLPTVCCSCETGYIVTY